MTKAIPWFVAALFAMASSSALAQDWRREPTFGATHLRSGFTPDPAQYPLTAGGGSDPINVSTLGLVDSVSHQPCGQAFITRSPDFRFYFEPGYQFNFLRMYVVTHNSADATLLINQPDTTWRCNDDSFGTLMPAIDFTNPQPGQYDIWVGTYDASSHNPSTFFVTELQQNHPGTQMGSMPTPTHTPTPPIGQVGQPTAGLNTSSMNGNFPPVIVAAGFLPDPQVVSGTSGGSVSVGSAGVYSVNSRGCTGYVSSNPDHILTLNSPFGYLRIDAVASGGGDTTMVMQDPYGNFWCSDDDGGYPNPRIEGTFNPGMYRIWIGSYSSGQYHPYTLSVTEYRP